MMEAQGAQKEDLSEFDHPGPQKKGRKTTVWTETRSSNLIAAIKKNPWINAEEVKKLDSFVNDELTVDQIRSKMSLEDMKELREKLQARAGQLDKTPVHNKRDREDSRDRSDARHELRDRSRSSDQGAPADEHDIKRKKRDTLESAREEKAVRIITTDTDVVYCFAKPSSSGKMNFVFDRERKRLYKTVTWAMTNLPVTNEWLKKNGRDEITDGEIPAIFHEETTFVNASGDHDRRFDVTVEAGYVCCIFRTDTQRFTETMINLQ
jgi:hypothetical protein